MGSMTSEEYRYIRDSVDELKRAQSEILVEIAKIKTKDNMIGSMLKGASGGVLVLLANFLSKVF